MPPWSSLCLGPPWVHRFSQGMRVLGSQHSLRWAGSSWAVFGPSWAASGRLGSLLEASWGGRLGAALGRLWASWGCLEASWIVLGRFWWRLRAILGRLGDVLGPSWVFLAPSWGPLAASWGPLVDVLGTFGGQDPKRAKGDNFFEGLLGPSWLHDWEVFGSFLRLNFIEPRPSAKCGPLNEP